eukprot:CAMPEP_0170558870 /NCGR_PEP_ID=MMETSP0211-20121228/38474_1 /TAXON_ID=311385 /ORGANISM="Pseudokeronopsis sp., Strain OXSARD2" /LENGTH=231 /DNA_ID=CAMNT_0010871257 /DNA_START=1276 /DNA_END=1971 /DNA_ORIENTATION=+
MIKAESRVAELETSLAQFIEDFEKQNADLTVCAQKLTLSENRVQFLTKRSQELERETKSLTEKLCNIKKPPSEDAEGELVLALEGSGKANIDELIKQIEVQSQQIINLSKSLEGLRKEHLEYFNKSAAPGADNFLAPAVAQELPGAPREPHHPVDGDAGLQPGRDPEALEPESSFSQTLGFKDSPEQLREYLKEEEEEDEEDDEYLRLLEEKQRNKGKDFSFKQQTKKDPI